MGEVYRATDTKLNRDVALKVIPELFANDPDRMARFSREAQVLASLNHPNIASIHGLEESGGTRAHEKTFTAIFRFDRDELSKSIEELVEASRELFAAQ